MSVIARREPFRELQSLIDSVFDAPTVARAAASRRWVPAMDLLETDDHYVLRADLPGASEEDVKVEIEDRVLTVSGERKAERDETREGYHLLERSYGSFARKLMLPKGVDAEKVAATFDRGVLEVRIPKPEASKPRRVSITVGDGSPALEGSEAE